MPIYTYKALSDSGAQVRGEVAASSPEDLTSELAGKGLLVQRVRRKQSGGALLLRHQRIKPEAFLLFNQEFMALIRAGLTVPEALVLAADRPDQPALGRILGRVLEEVRGGALISEACSHHPEAFEGLYLSALKTGEKTGDLAAVLFGYQNYLKHRVALQKKVSQALAYPSFLLITLVVILGVLFAFVMPRFVAMYADFGAELPLPTKILLGFVDHLPVFAPLAAGLILLALFGYRWWSATDSGRLQIDHVKERLPWFGGLNRTLSVAQAARTLATLLTGGTPLVEAMKTTADALTNRLYAQRLREATNRVTEGESLAQAMRQQALLPPTALKMVEVGEASGSLDTMLAEVAQFYEENMESRLGRIMALIEPALMLLMGVLIGGVIIVMYLPIFNIAEVVQ